MTFDHIEGMMDKIAEMYGEEVMDKIMRENSYRTLCHYAEKMNIEQEHLDELLDDVRENGW